MLCLCDFFNQRGDLFEKAVKPYAVSGPEAKKFLVALDLDMKASDSGPLIKVLIELAHTCPSLQIAISLQTGESSTDELNAFNQESHIKQVRLSRVTDKQAIDLLLSRTPKGTLSADQVI